MAIPNAELMSQARAKLEGRWTPLVLAVLIFFLIVIGIGQLDNIPHIGKLIGFIANFIVGAGFDFGFACLFLRFVRGEGAKPEEVFNGFKSLGRAVSAKLQMCVYVFLWMLLLIVPGIIAAYAYSQTFYIMADNPEMGASDAITQSKAMMKGYKWKLFCLHCRFIGWALLCILTLGIGLLWLLPYIGVAMASFYEDVKAAGKGEAVAG